KKVSRRRRRAPEINEVNIMKNLTHPCVVRMHDAVENPKTVYILLEVMAGGDLLERIVSNTYLSEELSKLYFYQLCHAIKYLHDRNIIHRDLKLENILLETNDEETLLKVCDFGLSRVVRDGVPLVYTKKVDIWSLGVVLYCCLSGSWPFGSINGSPFTDQIEKGEFTYDSPSWEEVSHDAKLLINEIFTVDPKNRPSIIDLLQNRWFCDAPMQLKAKR
ncbi:hypothetical protein KR200_000540, partial [Drosophila serrata]